MKDFLQWFNGKKSVLGGIFSVLVGFAQAKELIAPDTAMLLLELSALILAVGMGHKMLKAREEKKNESSNPPM